MAAPSVHRDSNHAVTLAAIAAYGDTVHLLVERDGHDGPFLPGYEPASIDVEVGAPVGLTRYDHVVANVGDGELEEWVDWYARVWGLSALQHFDEDAISTEFSALRSTVVGNGGRVVQPINEPAEGRRKSQISRVPRLLRRRGGAAHRATHRRHRRDRGRAASARHPPAARSG